MFTRRHFERLATITAHLLVDYKLHQNGVGFIAGKLKETNENFSPDRFREAVFDQAQKLREERAKDA